MSTMILTAKDVCALINMKDVLHVVEEAFIFWAKGKGAMPAKAYLLVENGDFRAMPASLYGCAGMKWVNAHPKNSSHGLPSVMAVIIYNDPLTGYPLAIMDGTAITAFRTGAAAAIASKYLARKNSQSLGIIGAGRQAFTQILAHSEVFKFKVINVFDISRSAIDKLIYLLPDYPINSCPVEEVVKSDIVCTLTPAREPFIRANWIKPGTHVNAIGADAAGKQEFDPSILADAIVVVDDIRQAIASGEINVPIAQRLFKVDQVYATLAEIVFGIKKGRENNSDITLFDSTGIAIEDIAVAKLIYEKAQLSGGHTSVELVDA